MKKLISALFPHYSPPLPYYRLFSFLCLLFVLFTLFSTFPHSVFAVDGPSVLTVEGDSIVTGWGQEVVSDNANPEVCFDPATIVLHDYVAVRDGIPGDDIAVFENYDYDGSDPYCITTDNLPDIYEHILYFVRWNSGEGFSDNNMGIVYHRPSFAPTPTPARVIIENFPTSYPITTIIPPSPTPTPAVAGFLHEQCSLVTDTNSSNSALVMTDGVPNKLNTGVVTVPSQRSFTVTGMASFSDITDDSRLTGIRMFGNAWFHDASGNVNSVLQSSFSTGGHSYSSDHNSFATYSTKNGYLNGILPLVTGNNFLDYPIYGSDVILEDLTFSPVITISSGNIYEYHSQVLQDLSVCLQWRNEDSINALPEGGENTIYDTPNSLTEIAPTSCNTGDIFCFVKNWFVNVIKYLFVPSSYDNQVWQLQKSQLYSTFTSKAPLAYVFFPLTYDWDGALSTVPEYQPFNFNIDIPNTSIIWDLNLDFRPVSGSETFISYFKGIIATFLYIEMISLIIGIAKNTFDFTKK